MSHTQVAGNYWLVTDKEQMTTRSVIRRYQSPSQKESPMGGELGEIPVPTHNAITPSDRDRRQQC